MAGFVQEPAFTEAPEVRHGHTVPAPPQHTGPLYTAEQVFALIEEAVHAVTLKYEAGS